MAAVPVVIEGMAEDHDPTRDPKGEAAMLPVARTILREWMRSERGFEAVGQKAIGLAADAAARLSRPSPVGTEAVLAEVEGLADSLGARPRPRRRWWSAEPVVAAPADEQFAALAGRIDRQRDETMRAGIVLAADRTRFEAAEAALVDALRLLDALDVAVEAAMRELRGADPAQAQRLQEKGTPALLERRRDLLTQLAVSRQGLMTLDLLLANQTALGGALERARTAMQIGLAARRALAQGQAVSRQTAALTQMAGAAGDGSDHARRMLADAVAQARRAIAGVAEPRQ